MDGVRDWWRLLRSKATPRSAATFIGGLALAVPSLLGWLTVPDDAESVRRRYGSTVIQAFGGITDPMAFRWVMGLVNAIGLALMVVGVARIRHDVAAAAFDVRPPSSRPRRPADATLLPPEWLFKLWPPHPSRGYELHSRIATPEERADMFRRIACATDAGDYGGHWVPDDPSDIVIGFPGDGKSYALMTHDARKKQVRLERLDDARRREWSRGPFYKR